MEREGMKPVILLNGFTVKGIGEAGWQQMAMWVKEGFSQDRGGRTEAGTGLAKLRALPQHRSGRWRRPQTGWRHQHQPGQTPETARLFFLLY